MHRNRLIEIGQVKAQFQASHSNCRDRIAKRLCARLSFRKNIHREDKIFLRSWNELLFMSIGFLRMSDWRVASDFELAKILALALRRRNYFRFRRNFRQNCLRIFVSIRAFSRFAVQNSIFQKNSRNSRRKNRALFSIFHSRAVCNHFADVRLRHHGTWRAVVLQIFVSRRRA